jgi:MFS family permease
VFGPKRTLIRIVLWWSLFTALTGLVWNLTWDSGYVTYLFGLPLLLNGFIVLLTIRFLFGVGEAGAYPNIARALQNWFPFRERGSAQGAVWMAGRFMGGLSPLIVMALVFHTVAADTGERIVHWRHIFWIFGLIGVVWCVFFWWWFRDLPEEKKGVSPAELQLIHGEDGPPAAGHAGVPWLGLMRNLNLWTLCAMYFCCAYGWYFNITWLPKYLKEQHGVTTDSYGFWTFTLMAGAPLLFGSFACLFGGLLSDFFIHKTGNRKWGRRIFGLIGHSICAACYFLSILATNPWMFVLAIAMAAFWNDLTMGSAWATCQDIGKKYAGIVSGCMNTIGNLGGAVAGWLTGRILVEAADRHQGWTINFVIFGSVYVVAAFLWLRIDSTKMVPQSK